MIKILSQYSNFGGSTEFFIALTNALNERGHECLFYGPFPYPKGKCNFTDQGVSIEKDDICIYHMHPQPVGQAKMSILSCHEKERWPLKEKANYMAYDKIHFVSQHQADWHDLNRDYFVIPPMIEDLKTTKCKDKVAGVVGFIGRYKNTHIAIKQALKDGFKKVILFGHDEDKEYYQKIIRPMVDGATVEFKQHEEDKQEIYDSISDLYNFSPSETYSMTITEAMKAGVKVHTPKYSDYANCYRELDNNVLTDLWIKELGL